MSGATPKAVTGTDGTVYPSHKAAADALGVCRSAVSFHIKKYGNLDRLGYYRTAIADGSQTWGSLTEASKALGVSRGTLNWHLDRHGHLGRVGKRRSFRTNPKPLQIGPLRWAARVDAAADLGIHPRTLRDWTSPKATAHQVQRLYAAVMELHRARETAAREEKQAQAAAAAADAKRARARDRYRDAAIAGAKGQEAA